MDVVLDFRGKYTEVAKHLKITIHEFWPNYTSTQLCSFLFIRLVLYYAISWPQARLHSCELIFIFCIPDN